MRALAWFVGGLICTPCFLIAGLVVFIWGMSFTNGHIGVTADPANSAYHSAPPPALADPVTLRVMTFNIQDLGVVAQDHVPRMKAIARKLSELDPDIVGFQESFTADHRAILTAELQAQTRLVYFQYYSSGIGGSGLLTASALPIEEVYFHRYTVANPWWKVWEGDWWAGKGVSLARVRLGNGALFDLFNTHAQAGYGNPAYTVIREQQMAEAAEFINACKLPNVPAVLVGDLNCRVGDPDFERVYAGASLMQLRTMTGGIDHILGVQAPGHTFEVTETVRVAERFTVREFDPYEADPERTSHLTDHPGFLSVIRITPG